MGVEDRRVHRSFTTPWPVLLNDSAAKGSAGLRSRRGPRPPRPCRLGLGGRGEARPRWTGDAGWSQCSRSVRGRPRVGSREDDSCRDRRPRAGVATRKGEGVQWGGGVDGVGVRDFLPCGTKRGVLREARGRRPQEWNVVRGLGPVVEQSYEPPPPSPPSREGERGTRAAYVPPLGRPEALPGPQGPDAPARRREMGRGGPDARSPPR